MRRIAARIVRIVKGEAAQIEIIFVNARRMRQLNKRFTGRERATDVLSFRIERDGKRPIAQIIISSDAAAYNAPAFGATYEEELVRYVAHGLLHFYGYRDAKRSERARMSDREDTILRSLCEKEDLSRVSMRR